MMIVLGMNGTIPADQFAFSLLMSAFRARGGVAPESQRLSKSDRRADAKINEALREISVIDPDVKADPPKAGVPDARPRVLKNEPVELMLEQPEFERLQKFFDADTMLWQTHVVEVAEELSQRLARASSAVE